jgi:hypothetical protein
MAVISAECRLNPAYNSRIAAAAAWMLLQQGVSLQDDSERGQFPELAEFFDRRSEVRQIGADKQVTKIDVSFANPGACSKTSLGQ